MSLIRQIWLLLAAAVLLTTGGALAVNLLSVRDTLQTQLRLKNSDNAQALALALSQQRGDRSLIELLMAAQFDTGYYRHIRLVRSDGQAGFERRADGRPAVAPTWFVRLLPIESVPGLAQVSDGWRGIGTVEVVSQASYVHDEMWRGGVRAAMWMVAVALVAGLLAALVVKRIRRPLDATVDQARSLIEGRYVIVDEPQVPELRRLAQAMNGMVERVHSLFEAQAEQAETLRRQAQCDPLTGLLHRRHFMRQLIALLQREDGVDGGGLVLVRLADLNGLNAALGREAADNALNAIARVLQAYPAHAMQCFAGRLNGSDFALCLPEPGMAADTALSVAAALRSSLPALGAGVQAHLGAVELRREHPAGVWLAHADQALARAEAGGAFAVELFAECAAVDAFGENLWREQVGTALVDGRSRLMAYPVLDAQGALLHLECPLRLQLEPDGPFEVAARWLPLAMRTRQTASADRRAIELALAAIMADGRARGVNVALASLADAQFAMQVRAMLLASPDHARSLWLEVGETDAVEQFDRIREFSRLMRSLGVRFGLEHAGVRMRQIDRLYELGLDYVKLDASVCQGLGDDVQESRYVASMVTLLHGLSVQVHAEGVVNDDDARALWACGIDGITGPWASGRFAVSG